MRYRDEKMLACVFGWHGRLALLGREGESQGDRWQALVL